MKRPTNISQKDWNDLMFKHPRDEYDKLNRSFSIEPYYPLDTLIEKLQEAQDEGGKTVDVFMYDGHKGYREIEFIVEGEAETETDEEWSQRLESIWVREEANRKRQKEYIKKTIINYLKEYPELKDEI